MIRRVAIPGVLAALAFTLASWGQVTTTGRITGVVHDATGAVVPHAAVTVVGQALMAARLVSTAGDGSYLVTNLPPGTYTLTAVAAGFQTFVQPGITLTAGFSATVNPRLQVGESVQRVEVTGAAPTVDVKTETTSTTFNSALLQDLPSGRDPWSTLQQAPAITSSQFDVGGNQSFYQSTMSVHGSIPGQQVYSFNGLNLSWPGANGGYTAFYIDDDALQELQAVTDAAPADVSVGGVYINLVTKSGSNQFHGGASSYYSTAGLQSQIQEPIFNGAPAIAGQPMVMVRDTEANLGGPVIPKKWWVFGAWAFLVTKESELASAGKDPLTGGYLPPPSASNHQSDVTLRNDFQLGNNNHISATWWWNEQNQFQRNTSGFAFTSIEATSLQIEPAYILQADWTTSLGPAFVLDTRLGYMHLIFPLYYEPSVGPNDIAVEDIGLSTLTGAATSNYVNPATEWRVSQEASYFLGNWHGSHNFKFGWDDSTNRNGNDYSVNQNMVAIYNNGAPLQVQIFDGPVNEESIFHAAGAFAQDSWTLGKLTLNVGLRYDRFHGFNPQQSSPGVAHFAAQFPATRTSPYQSVALWNNFSPRLGLAYDPTGHGTSVIRASYSRFMLTEGTELGDAVNPQTLASQTYNWNGAKTAEGLPDPAQFLQPANLVAQSGGIFTTIDPNLRRPYSTEATAGYERQLAANLALSVDYYWRGNRRQYGQFNMANLPSDYTAITALNGKPILNPLTSQPTTLYSLNAADVGLTQNLITQSPAADANSYNAIEFTAKKRLTSNWQLLSGLTISRDFGTFTNGLFDDFNNPNLNINRTGNYLNQDSTYVFKLEGSYEYPRWHLNGSINYQHYTGYPLQPTNTFVGPELGQGAVTVVLAPAGTAGYRLPNVDNLSVRISRPTQLTERIRFEPILDIFNITNSSSITGEVGSFGPSFLEPYNLLNPRLFRLGARLTF